jgi:hypothetical protein
MAGDAPIQAVLWISPAGRGSRSTSLTASSRKETSLPTTTSVRVCPGSSQGEK